MPREVKPRLPPHDHWATEPRGMEPLRNIGASVVVETKAGQRSATVVFVTEHPQLRQMMFVGYRWAN